MNDMDIKEYRIKISVRNNLILTAIEKAGYASVAAFCRTHNIGHSHLNDLISLRDSPLTYTGEFSTIAVKLMDALDALPTDLWTAEQFTIKLRRNTATLDVSHEGMRAALGMNATEALQLLPEQPRPDEALETKERDAIVNDVVDTLTPREARILRMRFGLGCPEHSLEEVAVKFDVTRERIRQIEAKAMRKLKHPQRLDILRPLVKDET